MLHAGGFGKVYAGEWHDEAVAIKLVSQFGPLVRSLLLEFQREVHNFLSSCFQQRSQATYADTSSEQLCFETASIASCALTNHVLRVLMHVTREVLRRTP